MLGAILLVLSLLALIVGFVSLSEATFGVGLIGVAAVLGVFARIMQADRNHKELKELLKAGLDVQEDKA